MFWFRSHRSVPIKMFSLEEIKISFVVFYHKDKGSILSDAAYIVFNDRTLPYYNIFTLFAFSTSLLLSNSAYRHKMYTMYSKQYIKNNAVNNT